MCKFFNISFTNFSLNFYSSFSVMDSSTTETSITLCHRFGKGSYLVIDLTFLSGHSKTLFSVSEQIMFYEHVIAF